jgi:hypothetical protein
MALSIEEAEGERRWKSEPDTLMVMEGASTELTCGGDMVTSDTGKTSSKNAVNSPFAEESRGYGVGRMSGPRTIGVR